MAFSFNDLQSVITRKASEAAEKFQSKLAAVKQAEHLHDIQTKALELAKIGGEVEAYSCAAAVFKFEGISSDRKQILIGRRLTALLCRGADDSWSGRSNDNRRTAFDGIREAAWTIMELLERMDEE